LFTFLPLCLTDTYLTIANQIGISFIVALGLYFLTGCCGIINLGQAGFMCTGAFAASILVIKCGFSPWLSLPCAIVSSGLVGLIFGLPALRIKGFSLAVSTLAAGIVLPELLRVAILPSLGMPTLSLVVKSISIGGRVFDTQGEKYFIIMLFLVLLVFVVFNMSKLKAGRAFKSIRDNELAAEVGGVNVARYKLLAFVMCGLFAGIGGWLWAFWAPAVSYLQFPFSESIWYLAILVVGGMVSIPGIFIGSIIVRGINFLTGEHIVPWVCDLASPAGPFYEILPLNMVSRAGGIFPLLLGITVIVFILFAPGGVSQWGEKFKLFYRSWPFSYELK
jgi:branched-chain amino acid transport system permease protein